MRSKKPLFSRHYVRLLVLVLLAVVASFFAKIGWFFELFSHFTAHYAAILGTLALLLLFSKRYGWSVVAAVVFGVQIYQVLPLFQGNPNIAYSDEQLVDEEGFEAINVLQYNVNRENENVNNIVSWITQQSQDIDIVVLQEVTDKWQVALERLKWIYPYHISKEVRGNRQIIILSRLMIDELEIMHLGEDGAAVIIRGATIFHDLDFVLYGVHPPPPILPSYANSRNNLMMEVGASIADEQAKHKVLVGDFNMTRYSPYFKKVSGASSMYDSNEGMGYITTWPSFAPKELGISIDNMLLSTNIVVKDKKVGPALGSDHRPVISHLKFMVPKVKGELSHASVQGADSRF
mgnify:CR=1 FL=1